ncbi:MAG: hypothetical protein LBS37_10400, partial [Treponema sp.]|nr:hypothetical protein [Treponema sp.]
FFRRGIFSPSQPKEGKKPSNQPFFSQNGIENQLTALNLFPKWTPPLYACMKRLKSFPPFFLRPRFPEIYPQDIHIWPEKQKIHECSTLSGRPALFGPLRRKGLLYLAFALLRKINY